MLKNYKYPEGTLLGSPCSNTSSITTKRSQSEYVTTLLEERSKLKRSISKQVKKNDGIRKQNK